MYHRTTPKWQEDGWLISPPEGSPVTITATEGDKKTFSGLYDSNGIPLHRPQEKLGFIK
jgi:hypothetical protein